MLVERPSLLQALSPKFWATYQNSLMMKTSLLALTRLTMPVCIACATTLRLSKLSTSLRQ